MNALVDELKTAKEDRLRSLVLSDILRAELKGAPLHWARYCANNRRRGKALEQALYDRNILQLGENCGLTFNGLVLMKTPAAKSLLADCQRVYKIIGEHYHKELFKHIVLQEITNRITKPARPVSRIVFAVTMLKREGGPSIGGDGAPLTEVSKIHGNQSFLDVTFPQRVKALRATFTKSKLPILDGAAANRPPGFPWGGSQSRADLDWLFSSIEELGNDNVKADWSKCIERGTKDTDGAITAAKTLLESTCKQILQGRKITYDNNTKLPVLYGLVKKSLELDPAAAADSALQTIVQGTGAVVSGLGALRNALGDGHGKGPGSPKPPHRHARLACALAGAMAAFLLATDEGRKLP
jgi:hypothetical protein